VIEKSNTDGIPRARGAVERASQSATENKPAAGGIQTRNGQARLPSATGPDSTRRREDKLTVGRLQDHGRAPYQFRPNEAGSYFVKVLTNRGERVLWGKDLERALNASATQPKIGDQIGARRVGREAVTILARERDAEGRIIRQSEQLAHRSRWVVEKVQFFAERAKLAHRVREAQTDIRSAVKSHPELMSTFLTLRGAQEIAERRIADPKDRERFVALVREAMAGSIKKGEPLPAVRIREASRAKGKEPPPAPIRSGDDERTR
jgi:putative DNA primase/helicase